MASESVRVHIYGRQDSDGQWTLMCLDFDLAAQDASLKVAEDKLKSQISSFLREAHGIDSQHASSLLNRPAPLKYWLAFYFYRLRLWITNSRDKRIGTHVATLATA